MHKDQNYQTANIQAAPGQSLGGTDGFNRTTSLESTSLVATTGVISDSQSARPIAAYELSHRHRRHIIRLTIIGTLLLLGGSLLLITSHGSKSANQLASSVSQQYGSINLPLSGIKNEQASGLTTAATVSVNGRLNVNNSLVLTPSVQPSAAVAGQLYFDTKTNHLAYFDGSGFQAVATSNAVVGSIGGLNGAINLGNGLGIVGGKLSYTGTVSPTNVVTSLQGQSGNVSFSGGAGISVAGTAISNTGVLSLDGSTGAINIGTGLRVQNGTLSSTAVAGVTAGSNITVTPDGNGGVVVSGTGTGGTVGSSGGTVGKLAYFSGTQTLADSLISQNGTAVTVAGDLHVTGTVTLATPLAVTGGGTAATTAAGARINLGAAANGANTDITSLTGLTTALSVGQGGTGLSSLTANGLLYADSSSSVSQITSSAGGLCLVSNAGAAPTFQTCTGAGGVTSVNGQGGAIVIAGTTNQITVTQSGSNFTFSTPQDLATNSSVSFSSVTAGTLSGNGSSVTNVNAAQLNGQAGSYYTNATNLTNGTLSDTRLSTNVTLQGNTFNGASQLVELSASGNLPALDGSLLTDLNGASITTGIINDSHLSSNVSLYNNTTSNFTGSLQQNGSVVCTVAGNCTGVAGGSIGGSGTANKVAIFTGTGYSIGNSILSQDAGATTVSANGALTVTGAITAASFTGDGTAVTNVNAIKLNGQIGSYYTNASNLASGTVADARLSTTVTLQGNTFNGPGQLIQTNASGYLPALNASLLTNINATALSSGTVADARLSGNVAFYNNTTSNFTGNLQQNGNAVCTTAGNCTGSGNGGVTSINSQTGDLTFNGTANQVSVTNSGGTFSFATPQDIGTTSAVTFGTLNATSLIQTNGTTRIDASGNLSNIGTISTSGLVTAGGGLTVGGGNITFNNLTGGASTCLTLNASNQVGVSTCATGSGSNPTLQNTYDNSGATPVINLSTAGKGLFIQDAGTPVGGNLFAVKNSAGTTSYFAVTAAGASVTGSFSATSFSGDGSAVTNVNATQLNGQSASYYLNASNVNAGTLADARLSGNVTLQGNTFNGANQLVKLDGSGYLPALNGSAVTNVNAALLNGQAASYYLNASNISAGTLSDSRLSTNVALYGNTTSNFTGALQQNGNNVCTVAGNCTGVAGGSVGGNGTAGKIAVFTASGYSIGDSLLSQDSPATTVSIAGNLSVSGLVTATSFSGDGSAVTNVNAAQLGGQASSYYTNATNLSTGTVADGRLSSNVALLNGTNNFTGTTLQHNGNSVCDASNNCSYLTGSAANTNYIQNNPVSQQTANFNVLAGSGLVSTIQAASGQDILDFKDENGTIQAAFDNSGDLTIGQNRVFINGTVAGFGDFVTSLNTRGGFSAGSISSSGIPLGTTGLLLRETAGQTANAFEIKTSSGVAGVTTGTLVTSISATGNIVTTGTIQASSFNGDGSGLTNVNAAQLNGQAGSYYQNATNINAGTLADTRLSTNVALYNAATANFTGTLQQGGNAVCTVAGNCSVIGAAGGDLSGTYPNPTVAKIKNTAVTFTALSSGDVLQYNGSNIVNGKLTNTNLTAGSYGNITGVGVLGSLAVGSSSQFQVDAGGNVTGKNITSSGNLAVTATSGVAATIQGSNSASDIAQFVKSTGAVAVKVDQYGNFLAGAATYTVSLASAGAAGVTVNVTNSNTANVPNNTVNGQTIVLNGTANSNPGSNFLTGLYLNNVTPTTNNYFTGINLGTGYDNFLTYNGTQIISGLGKLQNTGLDGSINYSNLQNVTNLTASSNFYGPSLDTPGSGSLNIGNTNATSIGIASNAVAHTVLLGTGGANQTVQVGTTTGSSTLQLSGGNASNAVYLQAAGSGGIVIGSTTGANSVTIGNTGATGTETVSIGTSNTAGLTTNITIGSTTGTNATTLSSGTGGTSVTSSGTVNIQAKTGLTLGTVAGSNSTDVNITSGNASAGLAGNIIIDTGSYTSGTPSLKLGTTNASGIIISKTGANTLVNGTLTSNQLLTANGGITNAGSTLIGTVALGDLASGPLGTSSATVDIYTSFTINPSATGRVYSIPAPANMSAGRILYISNISTNSFTIGTVTLPAGASSNFIWNGSAWTPTAVSTGVSLLGTFSLTSQANGGSISGNTLTLSAADTANPGLVSTTTQSFAGIKTFTGGALVATTSTSAFQVQNGGGNPLLTADTINNRIVIGTAGTPTGQLYVGGQAPVYFGMNSDSNINNPQFIAVQGTYAFVTSANNNKLLSYDISSGTPVYVGQNSDSNLSNPVGVTISGKYAYVTNAATTGKIVVYDISSGTPVFVSQNSDSNLNAPQELTIKGQYAYVVSSGNNKLMVYNISSGTPVFVSQNSDSNLNAPHNVVIQGRYAYVSNGNASKISSYDISSGTPVFVASNSDGNISGAQSVAVYGHYAYVASYYSNKILAYNIATGTPVYVGQNSDTNINTPQRLTIQGRYAYVASGGSSKIITYDLTSGIPVFVGQNADGGNLQAPYSVTVSGRYAFLASTSNNKLVSYDLGGAYIQQLQTGSIETTNLNVDADSAFAGNISLQNNLNVGGSTQISGNLGVTGSINATSLITASGGITITTAKNFVNGGSTLNSSIAMSLGASGSIGANTATVDVATTLDVTTTAASLALTIPSPTVTTSGRLLYVNNVGGSNTFTIAGQVGGGSAVTVAPGNSANFIWNGTAWTTTAVSTGVSLLGTFSLTGQTNGGSISGNTLTLSAADATHPGLVSNTTQTFSGAKSFTDDATITDTSTGAFSVQNASGIATLGVDTTNGAVLISSSSNSTIAFKVTDSSGNVAFVVDAANKRVGINTGTPGTALSVNGGNNINPSYPDGLAGTPLFSSTTATGSNTSTTYTVPAGKTLYMTNILVSYGESSTGTLAFNGITVASFSNSSTYTKNYASPYILPAGSTISCNNSNGSSDTCSLGINGMLLNTSVTPLFSIITATGSNISTTYTVPAGKTLYMTNIFDNYIASSSNTTLVFNGITVASFTNFATYTQNYASPYILPAGSTISCTTGNGSTDNCKLGIDGYLTNSNGLGG